MNQKKPFKTDKPAPTYLHEVKVNGRRLLKGMHATLTPPYGRKEKRRYQFMYAEIVHSRRMKLVGGSPLSGDFQGLEPDGPIEEELMLTFCGPVTSTRQKYRTVRESDVLVVHVRSEARR